MKPISRRALLLTMSLGVLAGSCRQAPTEATVTLKVAGMI
jgi:hypothetical protein